MEVTFIVGLLELVDALDCLQVLFLAPGRVELHFNLQPVSAVATDVLAKITSNRMLFALLPLRDIDLSQVAGKVHLIEERLLVNTL